MLRISLATFLTAASLCGQTTFATITGSVSGPAGAFVSGASVVAVHSASNYRFTAQSIEAGNYTIPPLREGAYSLRIQAAEFREFVVQNIEIALLEVRRIDARLQLGEVETTVEVTAGATLIETETARISDSQGALSPKIVADEHRASGSSADGSPRALSVRRFQAHTATPRRE